MNEHEKEARRIIDELDSLGADYADDGIVKTVLRQRIAQEWQETIEQARASRKECHN